MATSEVGNGLKRNSSSSTVKNIEQSFLTCNICFDVYTEPKCLPCLHTFCKECLSSYVESRGDYGAKRKMGFPCPICKQFVFVKLWTKSLSEWADEMQNNFLIQNMIDSLLPKPEPEPEPEAKSETDMVRATPTAPRLSENPTIAFPEPTAPPSYSSFLPYGSTYNSLVVYLPGVPRHRSELYRRYEAPETPTIAIQEPVPGYDWDLLYTRTPVSSSGSLVVDLPERMRPARSAFDLSPEVTTTVSANNPFRNRSSSNSDLSRGRPVVVFAEPPVPWRNYHETRPYRKNIQWSDVCWLKQRNSIVATDYTNCKVVLYRRMLTADARSVKVDGKPCSITVVDDDESVVVVNLQFKKLLIFIRIPSLEIIRKVKTEWNYRSVTHMAPYRLLAGTADRPARIDKLFLYEDLEFISHTVYVNGERWDIANPVHLCMISHASFFVSDSGKNSIICFDMTNDEHEHLKATKRYSITPTGDRKLRSPGGLDFDEVTGSVYTLDYGSNTVMRIIPGDTIRIETLLTDKDGINRPSSVCLGPSPDAPLCVVDWEGRLVFYKQHVAT